MSVTTACTITFILTSLLKAAQADEALVMVGGDYLPGFLDNEVEVWSPSPTCDLQTILWMSLALLFLRIRFLSVVDPTFMDTHGNFVTSTILMMIFGKKVQP